MNPQKFLCLHELLPLLLGGLLLRVTSSTQNYLEHLSKSDPLIVQYGASFIVDHEKGTASGFHSLGLKFVADIPLPGGASRFDYQTIDEVHRRLYISHMGANLVTVFDLDSRRVIANLRDIPRPTGILVIPELDRFYVSASAKNKVYVIDAKTLKVIDRVPTGHFPDGIAFDPESKRIFVSNEFGRAVTVFDASTNGVIANIGMGGEVGNTHYDPVSKLIYSAVQTRGELVAIDPKRLQIVARYHLDGCKGPHGFYIDSQTHYVFITGEDNATYVVFDLSSSHSRT